MRLMGLPIKQSSTRGLRCDWVELDGRRPKIYNGLSRRQRRGGWVV
jgi:hypothetical protein